MPTCRIISEGPKEKNIKMCDMKPLQVGYVVGGFYNGHLVMRTASIDKFEVIDLTQYREDTCWTDLEIDHNVKLLVPDEEVTITLKNN